MKLPVGKLDSKLLESLVFQNIHCQRQEVIQRPGIGEDCAVVRYGSYDCVLSTDPITGAVSEIGRLAIHITLNDIASNGVEPLGIMLAVMLPEGTTAEDVAVIMKQAGEAAREKNVEILGGHTEITPSVRQPVIVSTAIGKCPAGDSVDSRNIKEGDRILVTKQVGLEGTGIIASDRGARLSHILTPEELYQAKAMLRLTSVVTEGVIAGKTGVSGMHDVTEGGLLGAVWEMCHTSGIGAEILAERVPVAPVTEKLCRALDIDVLRLISSGCMLMVVDPAKACLLMEELKRAGVAVTDIGRMTKKGAPGVLIRGEDRIRIAPPESDELYKGLERAEKDR